MAKKSNYKNRYMLDNMTLQQKDSAVKKINERYTDICRTFGPTSSTANEYLNAMILTFGAENLHTAAARKSKATKRKTQSAGSMGIKQINRDKDMLKDIPSGDIQALLDRHTAGQIMKTVKEEAKQETEEAGYNVSEDDILTAMEYVNDFTEVYKDSDWYKIYWDSVGGKGVGNARPSYMTLTEMILIFKKEQSLRKANLDDAAEHVGDDFRRFWKTKSKSVSEVLFLE